VCHRVGKPNRRDEIPLRPQVTLQVFEKWAIDFVGPINPPTKNLGSRYIITTTEYLTRWEKETPAKDCSVETTPHFLSEKVITRFGCLRILMSDQGTHFIIDTIRAMNGEFEFYQQKSTPYHPQRNGTIEAFNRIFENDLTKICNVNRDNWDLKTRAVLWEYRNTCKKLVGQTPFRLVYGKEAVVPLVSGTQSTCSNNYQHERKGRSTRKVKPTNGNGRGQHSSRISPGSIERKRQILV
jgi:hypothetical protein